MILTGNQILKSFQIPMRLKCMAMIMVRVYNELLLQANISVSVTTGYRRL